MKVMLRDPNPSPGDDQQMEEALAHCQTFLGNNATIVRPRFMPYEFVKVKHYGKEAGGPWDYYDADSFTDWEADRVLA